MRTEQECLDKAAEMEQLAVLRHDPNTRSRYREIASGWRLAALMIALQESMFPLDDWLF
jgi:hypothetical protein